ncbi:DUF397 domain-containing protein [Streptomyces sp. 8N114]|uniref:DUF397 domain-containing protein n=1 Tax=Streptomyces sp. 8N114 TaxID=3457419 RepID=UPI003FD26F62
MHIPDASTLAVIWTKSSFSGGNNNCVEVAADAGGSVYLRDSKVPSGPALAVLSDTWRLFLADTQARAFDL